MTAAAPLPPPPTSTYSGRGSDRGAATTKITPGKRLYTKKSSGIKPASHFNERSKNLGPSSRAPSLRYLIPRVSIVSLLLCNGYCDRFLPQWFLQNMSANILLTIQWKATALVQFFSFLDICGPGNNYDWYLVELLEYIAKANNSSLYKRCLQILITCSPISPPPPQWTSVLPQYLSFNFIDVIQSFLSMGHRTASFPISSRPLVAKLVSLRINAKRLFEALDHFHTISDPNLVRGPPQAAAAAVAAAGARLRKHSVQTKTSTAMRSTKVAEKKRTMMTNTTEQLLISVQTALGASSDCIHIPTVQHNQSELQKMET